MTLPRPYGITDEELSHHGSVDRVIDARCEEAMRGLNTYEMPRPENFDWCPTSKAWGKVWASAERAEIKHEKLGFRKWMVMAGIGGTMTGVPVAHKLPTEESARAFARDFELGKIFCATAIGATLWEELVEAAWKVKKFNVDDKIHLKSLAREYGIIPGTNMKLDRGNLLETYRNGETIDDVLKAVGDWNENRHE